MSLFLTLLPVYLLGNLHCIGMCGPLVVFLGKHPFRHLYFVGRACSFGLAAGLAGAFGAVLNLVLLRYHVAAALSLTFGTTLLVLGAYQVLGWSYPGAQWAARHTQGLSQRLSMLLLQQRALPAFLFGFCTVLLPCGQTLIVFSACALEADPWVGAWNGVAFAVLTSPSLWLAMRAHGLIAQMKHVYRPVLGALALAVGGIAVCRGFADLGCMEHWILSERYHIALY